MEMRCCADPWQLVPDPRQRSGDIRRSQLEFHQDCSVEKKEKNVIESSGVKSLVSLIGY